MHYSKRKTKMKLRSMNSDIPKIEKKIGVTVFKSILGAFLLCLFIGCSIGLGIVRGIIKNAPDISAIDVAPSGYATNIYDSENNVIQTLVMEGSNRHEAKYNEFPKNLINAFIAIEDERFWTHNGIDIKGIFRAIGVGLSNGQFSEGASTITQQLIKNNVFKGGAEQKFGDLIERKIQEQYLAIKLEEQLPKETILEYYLNTINLGSNTLGVQAASQRYFHKDVSELTLSECAVIAAITQNPTKYNPITKPEKNAERRESVLNRMLNQGLITQAEYDEAIADDVYARIQTTTETTGQTVYSYFTDALINSVMEDLQKKLGYTQTQAHNMLYSGGLSIYTTMDPTIQGIVDEEINNEENYPIVEYSIYYSLSVTHADGTVTSYNETDLKNYHRKNLEKPAFKLIFADDNAIQTAVDEFKAGILKSDDTVTEEVITKTLQPQASMVIMEPTNGHVVAINGGRGEKVGSLSLNRATDSLRQPGSTFKVLTTYAPALDTSGATLATTYYDGPFSADGQQFVNWWNSQYVGYANIRQGIAYSMNIIATKCLVNTVTPTLGFEYAQDFGITSLVDSMKTENGVLTDKITSLALGGITKGVSNLELTAAYATIANEGVYNEPIFYTKILDHNGNILLDNEPESHTVLKKSTATLLTSAMQDTIDGISPWSEYGIEATGNICKVPGMSIAGKSGSTTDSNDVWFVGYSPYYAAGIWSGYDENKALGNGQSYHKLLWQKIMERIHEGKEDIGFPISNDLETAKICSKSGLLAIDGVCDSEDSNSVVYTEYFAKGTAPTEYCNRHVQLKICRSTGQLVTDNCPKEDIEQKVYLIIDPADDIAVTDDTLFKMPIGLSDTSCTLHTGNKTTVEETDSLVENTQESERTKASKEE